MYGKGNMMSFAANVKNIKKLTAILTGKDADVVLTYKGLNFGVTKPWHLRCEAREMCHETYDGAAQELADLLKKELADRISFTEKQTAEYKKTLGALDN
jgi:hypothetical protein